MKLFYIFLITGLFQVGCVKFEWKVNISEKFAISFNSNSKDCGVLLRNVEVEHNDIIVSCIKKLSIVDEVIIGTLCELPINLEGQNTKNCAEEEFLFFLNSEKLEDTRSLELEALFRRLEARSEPVPYLKFRANERVDLWEP